MIAETENGEHENRPPPTGWRIREQALKAQILEFRRNVLEQQRKPALESPQHHFPRDFERDGGAMVEHRAN